MTTTGHAIDGRDRTRHSRGTLFDHAAYLALRGNTGSWHAGGTDEVTLAHSLETVSNLLTTDLGTAYHDAHTWRFTPASFQLLTLELNLLRLIPWAIARIEPTDVIEFYVWLERRELPWLDVETQRLRLLRETVMETREQVVQLDPPQATPPTPSISAIVPLYNGAKHIEQSLRSILAQTLPPCEIIVVDDGSTDAGPDLVKAMAAHHPITLLTKPNGGQSSARNFGVAHSHGTLIALLDQDDMWYPRHLEELIKPFLALPLGAEIGWVYSDLDEVDENGLMVTRTFLKERSLGTHPKRSLIDCLKENMFVLPSASLISRKAFDAVGGFDEQLSGFEDDDLFLRLFRAGYDNIFFDVPLSKWQIFNESYSYTYRMRRSRAIYVKKLLQEYPDDPRRSRYYKRHLILPRFYPDALVEFRDALMADDPDRIAETRADLMFLVNQMPSAKQRILGRVLGMVRSPQSAKMAFAARPYLRPLYRRFF